MQHKTSKLAIPEIEGVTGTVIGRMLEFLFVNTNVEVTIYKDRVDRSKGANNARGRLKSTQTGGQTSKSKRPRLEALLVKMPNTSYADLLRTVKQTINPTDIGVEVKDIKKTKSGELLLTVQNGEEKLEALKREITNKIPKPDTSRLTTKKVLHIKDLDEVTTIEEIKDAIKQATVKPECLEIRALRPAYANRQNVTVILPEIDALKLVATGGIMIGWTKYRVLERKMELKLQMLGVRAHQSTVQGPQ